jgi:hypothetical protein
LYLLTQSPTDGFVVTYAAGRPRCAPAAGAWRASPPVGLRRGAERVATAASGLKAGRNRTPCGRGPHQDFLLLAGRASGRDACLAPFEPALKGGDVVLACSGDARRGYGWR